jgi:hypothetical protein
MKNTLLLPLLLLGTLTGPAAQAAGPLPDGPFLSTTGRATLHAAPDQAILNISVTTQAPLALEAKQRLDTRVNRYLSFLRTEGIALSDINAAGLTTWPRYRVDKAGTSHPDGYTARRTLQVTVRQLERLSPLLDAALRDQLNDIRNITYGVSHPQHLRDQVRDLAMGNARSQAQALAEGAGIALGPVYSIRYMPPSAPPGPPLRLLGMRPDNQVPPATVDNRAGYPARALTFTDQVEVVYRLK